LLGEGNLLALPNEYICFAVDVFNGELLESLSNDIMAYYLLIFIYIV